ncbi:hypothetical protein CCR75_000472 [Bremia lactucae]|uniref:Uncharacterized protein n=1 Tax=Bremia lactucae TaxID=4779 RepID=A0A976FKI3_BRELC|nr:hypothetical protein CCR75_000472 [Bremia lactucae]
MGAKQTRVVTSDTELRPKNEQAATTQGSVYLTPALVNQINGVQGTHNKTSQLVGGMSVEQQTVIKKQLQMAYSKGVDDCRKKMELENKQNTSKGLPSLAQKAQLAKEQEERESERVQQLVSEISKKKYNAPLRDVQCSDEREACFQCYRNNGRDVLICKDVADAFVRCARQCTEVRT